MKEAKNEMADYIVKDEKETKKLKNIEAINADSYSKKNLLSEKQEKFSVNLEKNKYLKKKVFANGVVKSRIVGVEKYKPEIKKWETTFDFGIEKQAQGA